MKFLTCIAVALVGAIFIADSSNLSAFFSAEDSQYHAVNLPKEPTAKPGASTARVDVTPQPPETPKQTSPIAYIMGDSLIDDLQKNQLQEAFLAQGWQAEIRARRGRTIRTKSRPSGYEQALIDRDTIRNAEVIVIGLGVNNESKYGPSFFEATKELIAYLKANMPNESRIFWLSLYNKGNPHEIAIRNQNLRDISITPDYEFSIFPWHSIIVENPSWLEDQIHLWPHGSWHMGQLIAEHVTQ